MLFSSISFLYIFLPIAFSLYFTCPKKYRNYVLLILSIAFYFFGEPIYVILLIFSSISDYYHSLYIQKHKNTNKAKIALISSIIINLSMLFFFKYLDLFISLFNICFGTRLPLTHIPLPIGISFFTFQTMSYSIDVYRGEVIPEKNFFTFATFVSMFPQLIAGPIVRYSDIESELKNRTCNLDSYYLGIKRFVIGLAQKVLIANSLGEFIEIFKSTNDKSTVFFWAYAIAFSLQIYFDFAGYSNMAIGLGKILGFNFPENFNYPYISKSITEFWRRWHMTLGKWFRDYLYIPLGGNKKSKFRQLINITVVWTATGLWHGASFNFILWGLYFGVLLILEKFIIGKWLEKLPSIIRHIYLIVIVVLSFVIFDSESITEISEKFIGIFSLSGLPFLSLSAKYYISSYAIVFILSFIFATPILKIGCEKIKHTKIGKIALSIFEPILLTTLIVLSTAYIIDGSFNPFLYFRF